MLQIVFDIPAGALMGAFCLQLVSFTQLGWAAKLQLKKIVKFNEKVQRAAYVAAAAAIAIEVT